MTDEYLDGIMNRDNPNWKPGDSPDQHEEGQEAKKLQKEVDKIKPQPEEKSRHTKGEWRADIKSGCVVSDAGMICDIGFMNVNPEANARLIAAAPNMKIMLESNIVYLRNFKKLFIDYDGSKTAKEMVAIIDDIIKQNEEVLALTEEKR